jgi:anti-sigma factor RsiW
MPDCEFTMLLQAYHDGQLSAARMREAEQHVSVCAACAAELDRLRDLSHTLAAVRPEPIWQDELARLHDVISTYTAEERDDRRILRLGVGLSAVAASILIISTAWLYDGPVGNPSHLTPNTPSNLQTARTQEPWENVAVGRIEQTAGERPTGTARINNTTDWMIGGMKGPDEHGNP